MSAITSFILIPKSTIAGLRDAATPKKSFFGGLKDGYQDFLKKHGREVASYEWSGYLMATLLCYLKQEAKIDLMISEQDELSTFLTKTRGATHFIFTFAQKNEYLTKTVPESFSEEQLRDYYNKFNGANETAVGKPLLDGIQAIQKSLHQLEECSVVILCIG
jgi:hypothetical protein